MSRVRWVGSVGAPPPIPAPPGWTGLWPPPRPPWWPLGVPFPPIGDWKKFEAILKPAAQAVGLTYPPPPPPGWDPKFPWPPLPPANWSIPTSAPTLPGTPQVLPPVPEPVPAPAAAAPASDSSSAPLVIGLSVLGLVVLWGILS